MSARRRVTILEVPEAGLTSDWLRPIERSFLDAGVRGVAGAGPMRRLVGKAMNKAGLLRNVARVRSDAAIVQLAQLTAYRAFPRGFWGEIIPDCFDCWEPDFPRWQDLLRRMAPSVAFFSARQSAAFMGKAIPGLDAIWAPEGVDPTVYSPAKPLADRTIDILELGRRNDAYHSAITAHCSKAGYRHLFEETKGEIIFGSRQDLIDGLADTKISVCFPSSVTHPLRSGTVETMTQRYLESIASGNIILGKCPDELYDLFGFAPMVEFDASDPIGQIDHILAHVDDHIDLTKRSLARLFEVGTLDSRATRMLRMLEDRGYRV